MKTPRALRLKHIFRYIGIGTVAVVGVPTLVVLHKNDYELSSIGIVRFGRAFYTACRIVADYKLSLYRLTEDNEMYQSTKSAVHQRSANRLLDLACKNGGVWIKVGQHCGSLDYLLPPEYVKTLAVLHSKAPESSYEDVCKVIKEDLNVDPSTIFKYIDPKPIGAASLAQVHKAVLQDDSVVALKVQHRKVKPHSFVDCTSMEFLIHCVAFLFPEFKLMWLVEEMKKNIPVELDFVNEGQNTDRVRRMFSHLPFLKIPEIHWDYSSDRILIMEFCEGGQITDIEYIKKHNIVPGDICVKLGQLYSEMIFVQGYVHCDPHPGNVLVYKHPTKGQQIVLLDHGLYTTLDESFRLNYANLWLALLKADIDGIRDAAKAMGIGDEGFRLFACMVTARRWQTVQSGIDKKSMSEQEVAEIKTFVATYLPQISEVLSQVPRPMLLVFKTNDLLRGIEYTLKVQKNSYSFIQMTKYCVTAVHDYAYNRCDGISCRFRISFKKYLAFARIAVYEWFLSMFDFFNRLRHRLKHEKM